MRNDITELYQLHQPLSIVDKISPIACPKSGMYFWWADEDGLRCLSIPLSNKLYYIKIGSKQYYLCYIGIGPVNEKSKQPLFKRIFIWHLGKHIYASTLRYSIASLLRLQFYVKPKIKGKAYSLSIKSEEYITSILQAHFILSVASHKTPWDIEMENIQDFEPPLNIDHNEAGWYYRTIVNARANSRKNAVPN